MILQCPNCNARFIVADSAIPPEGRIVKCGKCAHNWHTPSANSEVVSNPTPAQPEQPAPTATKAAAPAPDAATLDIMEQALREATAAHAPPVAEVLQPAEQPTPKPAPAKPLAPKPFNIPAKPFVYATPALAVLWIVLLIMGHYNTWVEAPVVGSIYRTLGIHTTEGIVFEDVTMQPKQSEGRTKYILSGSIANHSSVDRIVPRVRVMLKDKSGEKLWEHVYVVDEPLKGGEVYPFRIDNVETSYGDKVASIVLDVGHKLQLMMR